MFVIGGISGSSNANQLRPKDTMKAWVSTPHPDLAKMKNSQSNNLNVPSTYFDSTYSDSLLGNHQIQGQFDERSFDQYAWKYFDAEDGYLVSTLG